MLSTPASVLDLLPDSVSLLSAVRDIGAGTIVDFRFDYVNPAGAKMQGLTVSELVGRSLLERHPGSRSSGLFDKYLRAVEKGESFDEEVLYKYEEFGSWYRLAIVKSNDGVLVVATDISRRLQSAERTRSLLAIATRLSGAVTPSDVADVVFHDGMVALGAGASSLAMMKSASEFEMVRSEGFTAETTQKYQFFELHPGRPISDSVLRGTPVILESPDEWAKIYGSDSADHLKAEGYKSFVSIPIIAGDRPLGALTFSFRNERRFDDDDRTFLETLGRLCAQALERSHAYEAEQLQRERNAFLADASRDLASSLDYETTLQRLARSAVPRLGDWCAVDMIDDPDSPLWPPVLRRLAVVHQDPAKIELANDLARRYPPDWDSPTGMAAVLKNRTSMLVPRVTSEMLKVGAIDAQHLELLQKFSFSAVIVVPLVARNRTLGALTLVMTESRRSYSDRDLELAEDLARRASIAVDNARLFRDAEDAEKRVAFLARASAELAASLEIEKTLDTIARLAVPEIADCCFVFLTEDLTTGKGRLMPAAVHHVDPEVGRVAMDFLERHPLNPDSEWGSMKVLRTGKPILATTIPPDAFDNVATDKDYGTMLKQAGFQSSVQVPIVMRGITVGTFTMASTGASGRRYHESDLDLAMEISARASVALENAQLYASERKAREDAEEARRIAEDASRTKSQFLAVMSHELRTPLNAIGGYAQLLELGVHGSMTESQLESVRRLKRSQQNLLALIEDLLSFAKLDTGKVEYHFNNVPLDKTLNEIETLVKPQLDAKGLAYNYCRVDSDVTIWADPDKFEQVILNLLTNAIKFTRAGSVKIECLVSDDDAKISVSDTGIGIAAEKLELIFDPFVQVHSGLTRTSTGSGLGLAISRDLARAMRGDITVESEEGKGSTFTLTIPTHEPS